MEFYSPTSTILHSYGGPLKHSLVNPQTTNQHMEEKTQINLYISCPYLQFWNYNCSHQNCVPKSTTNAVHLFYDDFLPFLEQTKGNPLLLVEQLEIDAD